MSLRELQDIFSLALFTYLPCFAKEAVQTGMSFRHFLPWILPTTVTEAMSIKTRFHWDKAGFFFPGKHDDGIRGTKGDLSFSPSDSRSSVWNCSERISGSRGDAQDRSSFSFSQQVANPNIVSLQCVAPLCLPDEKQASLYTEYLQKWAPFFLLFYLVFECQW